MLSLEKRPLHSRQFMTQMRRAHTQNINYNKFIIFSTGTKPWKWVIMTIIIMLH